MTDEQDYSGAEGSATTPLSNAGATDEEMQIAEAIPKQLRTRDFRFIKLFNPSTSGRFVRKGKEPMEPSWQIENNYAYSDAKIVDHINSGMNYGVLPRGLMCVLDVDDIQAFKDLEANGIIQFSKLFGDTFFVQTGHASKNHGHYYFQTKYSSGNGPRKIVLTHPDTGAHLGEIYQGGANAFVCGPNSLHESGNRYTVANDVPIKSISSEDFRAFISNFSSIMEEGQYQKTIPVAFADKCSQNLLTEKLGLKIQDIAMPDDAMYLGDGEYQGSHPIHGSETHHNFNININKNVWKCFRCDSGGDPAVYLAMQYGLITCAEAKPGVLSNPELFKDLIHRMKLDPRYGAEIERLEHEGEMSVVDGLKNTGKPDWLKAAKLVNDKMENKTYFMCHDGKSPEVETLNPNDIDVASEDDYDYDDDEDDAFDDGSDLEYTSQYDREDYDDDDDSEYDILADALEPDESVTATAKRSQQRTLYIDPSEIPKSGFNGVKETGESVDRMRAFDHNAHGSDTRYDVHVTINDDDSQDIIDIKKRDIFNPPSVNELELDVRLEEDNFVMRYVRAVSDMTDAYHEYHVASAYMLLSMIANRNAVMRMRQGDLYSNIWCFVLGTSSTSRKSTSMGYASNIAYEVNGSEAIPSDFTPEALIEFLSESPKRWLFKDECGTFLAGLQQKSYMASLRDIMCLLYDNKNYSRKLRTKKDSQNEFNVIDPYLSIYFSTTFDTFSMYTSRLDVTSGLFYRYLFFIPRHGNRQYFPFAPACESDGVNLDALQRDVAKRFKIMSSTPMPFEFCLDSEGWKIIQTWQTLRERQCEARTSYAQASVIARLCPMALKLAMLFTIGSSQFAKKFEKYDNLDEYLMKHKFIRDVQIPTKYIVEACRQIDEYFYPAIVYIVDDVGLDEENNDVVKILKHVERNGGRISITKLMQAMHMKKRELSDAMASLIESKELVILTEVNKKSGRTTSWVTMNKDRDDESDFYVNYTSDSAPQAAESAQFSKD